MRFTRPRRLCALALAVLWAAGPVAASFDAAHGVLADVECGAPALVPGHPTTQFEAVLPSLADHCAVCHLQRAFGGAMAVALRTIRAEARPAVSGAEPFYDLPARARRLLPSRAPPASLL
jgi:hypothetical protein